MLSQQKSERTVELLPGSQLPVGVVYTPTSAAVSLDALDITDLLHSKKYRVNIIFIQAFMLFVSVPWQVCF